MIPQKLGGILRCAQNDMMKDRPSSCHSERSEESHAHF